MKTLIFEILLPRLIAIFLLFMGVKLGKYGFCYLFFSGVVLGAYYGWFNDMIWRPNGKLEKSLPYRAHQIWVHIICGVTGSVALYFLLGVLDFSNMATVSGKIGWGEFLLFIIAILGYTGLLPRILWFFTYAQQSFK